MRLPIILLFIITLLGGLLRFYQLGQTPQSLTWDEVAIGYNAYSILRTGRDEYGNFLPTSFRSFEDYKSPLYVYGTTLSLAVFGKSEFAIRFLSAFVGTLIIPLLFFWTNAVLRTNKPFVSLLTSLLWAITPWSFHFSRGAFEANLALFFTILSTTFLLHWYHWPTNRLHLLYFSTLTAVAAMYSYASTRLFAPLIFVGLVLIFWRISVARFKSLLFATLFAFVLLLPQFLELAQGTGLARYQATSIFYRPELTQKRDTRILAQPNLFLLPVIYNHRLPYLQEYTRNYLSHFHYHFLFSQSMPTRFHIPGTGLLPLWTLPFLLLGTIAIFRYKDIFQASPLLTGTLLSIIPAAFTWDSPNPIRAYLILPALLLLTALGFWTIKVHLTNIPKTIYFTILVCLFCFSTLYTTLNYFTHLNLEFAQAWLWGRKEMITQVNSLQHEFHTVKISLSLDWSYIWYLWYANIDPQTYLGLGGTRSGAFDYAAHRIDNIHFTNFDYSAESQNQTGILFVGAPQDFPPDFIPSYVIENSEGQKLIYLVRS
jgi:4-amino-4-deoxy-L-arabinose transferase-like glycosyltransferase